MTFFNKSHVLLSVLIFGFLLAFSSDQSVRAAAPTDDYEAIQKSTVRVVVRYRSGGRNRTRYGTGWIITAADAENNAGLGTIVTAAHVVRGATRITVSENGSEESIVSTVKSIDRARDLAFVEVKDLSGTALTLTQKLPKIVAPLVTFGFTSASDAAEQDRVALQSSPKPGTFTKSLRGDGSLDLIEHSAVVNPGYSGGPLIDECGRVIGLLTKSGGHIDFGAAGTVSTAQGVGFAIAANEIIKFAGDENVDFQRDESDCTEESASAVSASSSSETSPTSPSDGDGKDAVQSEAGFSNNQMIAGLIIGLGFLITALAAFSFLRKNRETDLEDSVEAEGAKPLPSTSFDSHQSGKTSHDNQPEIGLSGRDAEGKSIDLKFRSSDASGDGLWLGADSNEVTGYITDERDQRLVSRVHAKIGFDGTNFTIMDNKSTNGTFIGNRKLSPMSIETIESGDVIKLADVALQVSIAQ